MNLYEIRTKFVPISYEFGTYVTEFSHLVHWDRRVLRKTLPISTGFPPHTMGRGDGARPKEPSHLVFDRRRRRRLQDLKEVVSKELAAPYTAKYLPDTGQIVLASETTATRTGQPEPSMEETWIMAVWQIPSLHRFGTKAPYLVWSMMYRGYGKRCTACFGS